MNNLFKNIRLGALAVVALLTTFVAVVRGEQKPVRLTADMSFGAPVPYVVIVDKIDDPCEILIPDSLFYEIAGRSIFKVNRTELNTESQFVHDLVEKVFPAARTNEWMLVGMDLRGAASPEGPYDNNVRLSIGRANALKKYLSEHIDSVNFNDVCTHTVAEDYPYLLWLLEKDGDSAAPVLRKIIEECGADNDACIKAKLQKYNGGRTWKRLLKDYYPKLRSARIVLYVKHINPHGRDVPDPTLAIDLIPEPDSIKISWPKLPIPNLLGERPHMLAISTNLLYDVFYMPNFGWAPMPNIGVEFFPKNNQYTVRGSFTFPYWQRPDVHKYFQIRDYRLEGRRYFRRDMHHTGAYIGVQTNFAKYGIGLSGKKGWQGEGFGAGLKAGYVLPLGDSRWHLDFHAAVGTFVTRYDKYIFGNPITGDYDGEYYYDWTHGSASFKKRNYRLSWLGPTEVGVTLSYDLLFYRTIKPGASLIKYETIFF